MCFKAFSYIMYLKTLNFICARKLHDGLMRVALLPDELFLSSNISYLNVENTIYIYITKFC